MKKRNLKETLFTCASRDNKLLQAHVNIQVFLENWKLKRKEKQGGC